MICFPIVVAVIVASGIAITGCAVGSVREAHVGGLGKYPEARSIAVQRDSIHSSALDSVAVESAKKVLELNKSGSARTSSDQHLTLWIKITGTEAAQKASAPVGEALSATRSFLGLAGSGSDGASSGRLEMEGRLKAPDGREVGYVRWEHEGSPEALAATGGKDIAYKVTSLVEDHKSDYAARRASDERFLLTPSAQTLAPGEIVISDDEVLLARLGVGLSKHLQLDFWTGGFPIPAAVGGTTGDGHAIISGGAAGVVVLGFFDLGLKLRLLDETPQIPGVAIAYDMLDVFGLGAGGVGAVLIGGGVGGGGIGVVAGSNAQFNLVTVTAGKHFGSVQVSGGTYLLDNHHFLTQSAGFQSGCAAAEVAPSGVDGGAIDCPSGSTSLPRLPLQILPYLSGEFVFGPHVSLISEALLKDDLASSLFTTGARCLLGWEHPHGPLALDRIRLRFDVAALWRYREAQGGAHPKGAAMLPLPWIGLGLYVF